MAKLDPQQNRYYPSKQKTGPLHDDFRQLFDHVYRLQAHNEEMKGRLDELENGHKGLAQQVAGGPSTTKIAGLYVKGTVPADGQVLKYSAKSGQIEWA